MFLQIEIGDDLNRKHPGQVRAGGELKAGENFFRDRDSADDRPALQDQDFLSRLGEISRSHEPIVTGADDDRVVVCHGELEQAPFHVLDYFQCREPARRRHDAAAGMRAGAAHVEILNRRAILRPTRHRAKEEKLV